MIAADFVTAGWFIVAFVAGGFAVLTVDAIHEIIRITRREVDRKNQLEQAAWERRTRDTTELFHRRHLDDEPTSKGVPTE